VNKDKEGARKNRHAQNALFADALGERATERAIRESRCGERLARNALLASLVGTRASRAGRATLVLHSCPPNSHSALACSRVQHSPLPAHLLADQVAALTPVQLPSPLVDRAGHVRPRREVSVQRPRLRRQLPVLLPVAEEVVEVLLVRVFVGEVHVGGGVAEGFFGDFGLGGEGDGEEALDGGGAAGVGGVYGGGEVFVVDGFEELFLEAHGG